MYHKNDYTTIQLQYEKFLVCNGPSCGQNGLNPQGWPPAMILNEVYIDGWTNNDKVATIDYYDVNSYLFKCNRIGKFVFLIKIISFCPWL